MRAHVKAASAGAAMLGAACIVAAHPGYAQASAQRIPGPPDCTNNLSTQAGADSITVRGNMAGCVRANLDFEITANGESSGSVDCANSTECSRPAFTFVGPDNACVTVTTVATGTSSLFTDPDNITKVFGAAGAANSRKAFTLC